MNQITQMLPQPISVRIVYDAIVVENPNYDMIGRRYTARVYGQCRGITMPLIIATPVAVHRVEDVVIADSEIDTVLAARTDLNNDRVAGAMARTFERLYALVNETEEAPYAP